MNSLCGEPTWVPNILICSSERVQRLACRKFGFSIIQRGRGQICNIIQNHKIAKIPPYLENNITQRRGIFLTDLIIDFLWLSWTRFWLIPLRNEIFLIKIYADLLIMCPAGEPSTSPRFPRGFIGEFQGIIPAEISS